MERASRDGEAPAGHAASRKPLAFVVRKARSQGQAVFMSFVMGQSAHGSATEAAACLQKH